MNCVYCGGCRAAQEQGYNRKVLFRRNVEQVRRDLIEVMNYTTTIMFDFDSPNDDLLEYCKGICDGLDLSNHFCSFTNLAAPEKELVEYINSKFKYVYWTLDVCSLSEKHRMLLHSKNMVKKQLKDEEIFHFLDLCSDYNNNEVRINLISGLPYFDYEDIKNTENIIEEITKKYNCISGLHWGRLHAQPGAPLAEDADKYDMISYASTYDEYLYFSELNLQNGEKYPELDNYNYPYIYYKDNKFNSAISLHHQKIDKQIRDFLVAKQKNEYIFKNYTYGDIHECSNQLANLLLEKGIVKGDKVVLLCKDPFFQMLAIIASVKAGFVYTPLDTSFPRIR